MVGSSAFFRTHFYKILLSVIFVLLVLQYTFNVFLYDTQYDTLFYFNTSRMLGLSGTNSFDTSKGGTGQYPDLNMKKAANVALALSHEMPHAIPTVNVSVKSIEQVSIMNSSLALQRNTSIPENITLSNSTGVKHNFTFSNSSEKTNTSGKSAVSVQTNSSSHTTELQTSRSTETILPKTTGIPSSANSTVLPQCPPVPPKLVGPVLVWTEAPSMEVLEKLHPDLDLGGRFHPKECKARHKVAVIIPYRDRADHLRLFLHNLHPILKRQQIDYGIYVIEQSGTGPFNRAMLLNVGAVEALKQYDYDCFIFHDVDLLPEDDRNLYTCPEQPRHMSVAVNLFKYKLPYTDLFGGVSAMTKAQFEKVNGFSNKFWGWGGEDDDMSNRIKFHKYHISRYPANIARYKMIKHDKEKANPKRYEYLYSGQKRFNSDGLISLKYKRLDLLLKRLYTWVYVELEQS